MSIETTASGQSDAGDCSRLDATPISDEVMMSGFLEVGRRQEVVPYATSVWLERQNNRLTEALKFASIEIAELRHQIRETLMENLHLADGDDCTLKRLKDAISFELEDSCENVQGMASARCGLNQLATLSPSPSPSCSHSSDSPMNHLPPVTEKGSPVGDETSEPEIHQPEMAVDLSGVPAGGTHHQNTIP